VVVPIRHPEPPSRDITANLLTDTVDLAALPALLTVEEAARLLRIGRTLAYRLARRYEATGGLKGLPVIRFGSCFRVPRWALIELITTGRVVQLDARDGR